MWFFYAIALPLSLGMVVLTLRYFAGPEVPRYVLCTVGYTWFCSLAIIILVPADIWTTQFHLRNNEISFFWTWSYWSTFLLTCVVEVPIVFFSGIRAVVPLIQGFEDAGDFTVTERLKTSVHYNLVFYLIVGSIGLLGLVLLFMMGKIRGGVLGFAMACSNTFGLVTGAFLLGFGLSEIPKSCWRNADWITRQKVLTHRVAKLAVKLDDAHQDLSNAIVVAQVTSTQMSKRDPLRPYMNVIDDMVNQIFKDDPSFKPQGGQLGENDLDYDTDDKSMATLRRHLRGARERYYQYKSEYMSYVKEALELEDTMRNYERSNSTGWKYISSFRQPRSGKWGSFLDTCEFLWRCVVRRQLQKVLAVLLGGMSAAILLAEATLLLPSRLDLSLFSILVQSVGKQEVAVQVLAFVPLMYMCICTYFSLFKVGMYMFYSLTPRRTSPVSLLMICSMVARYAPPISYNFMNLINLHGKDTIFEKRMGKIDHAVPFFGNDFNRIYPLFMVLYTLLVASNFFDRVFGFIGSWKNLALRTDTEDADGFDSSGVIILQKERSWLDQGRTIGEHAFPLARNFNDAASFQELETKSVEVSDTKARYASAKEEIGSKYSSSRGNSREPEESPAAKVSLLDGGDAPAKKVFAGFTKRWDSMKNGFQNFKANMGAKSLLPLTRMDESAYPRRDSSSESLDDIFKKLKRPSDYDEDDDVDDDVSGSAR